MRTIGRITVAIIISYLMMQADIKWREWRYSHSKQELGEIYSVLWGGRTNE